MNNINNEPTPIASCVAPTAIALAEFLFYGAVCKAVREKELDSSIILNPDRFNEVKDKDIIEALIESIEITIDKKEGCLYKTLEGMQRESINSIISYLRDNQCFVISICKAIERRNRWVKECGKK